MTRPLVFLFLTCLTAAPLTADTIYQTNSQGRQVVIQRDAIVVKEDSVILVYKHFDLRERRVTKVTLNKGSLPYTVVTGTPVAEKQIVELWKRFGYTTTVIDLGGKITKVCGAYLDFYPPGGRGSLLESVPARTAIPLQLDNGGADEIDFSKIDRIDVQGDRLRVSLRNGQLEIGKFLMPTEQPAEVRFLGITEAYDPSSTDVFDFFAPLNKLKQVVFE